MPVTNVITDVEARTLTIEARPEASVERVWQIYADPRQLERIWGPPDYPATFVDHSLTSGGRATFCMTGATGEKFCGVWEITDVDEPHSFTFDDYFADEAFRKMTDKPVGHNTITLIPDGNATILRAIVTYDTAEALQEVLDMGVVEGGTDAMNQIDGLLAA